MNLCGRRAAANMFCLFVSCMFIGGFCHGSVWSGKSADWNSDGDPGWNGNGIPNSQGAVAEFTTGGVATLVEETTLGMYLFYDGSDNQTRELKLNDQLLILDFDGGGPGYAVISNGATRVNSRLGVSSGSVELRDDLLLVNTGTSAGTYSISMSSSIGGKGCITVRNVYTDYDVASINLTGNNKFVGDVRVLSGTMKFNNSAFGDAGNIIYLGSEDGGPAAVISIGSATTTKNNIVVSGGAGGVLLLGSDEQGAKNSTFSGSIELNGDLNVLSQKTDGAGVVLSGMISGVGGLHKTGSGAVFISGENDFSGGVVVDFGTVEAQSPGALGLGNAEVREGALLRLLVQDCASASARFSVADGQNGSGKIEISDGVEVTADTLTIGGVLQPAGVYGSIGSGVEFEDSHFTGGGIMIVSSGMENQTLIRVR